MRVRRGMYLLAPLVALALPATVLLLIQAVTGKRVLGLAWSWFATLFRLRNRDLTVTEWRGRKMTLEARPSQKISIDGEIAARTPVTVEVALLYPKSAK